MKFLWCDTETTGIDVTNAAPFQVAFIFVSNIDGVKNEVEKVFYLNPFDIPGIEYSEDAGKIHGYSKETILSFEESKTVVKKIDEQLSEFMNYGKTEKMFFCGYNSNFFDFNHLVSLFKHHNLDFSKYFLIQRLDVFEQVKRARQMRKIPYLTNRKLTTVAEYLGVDLSNAHDALGDIRATREVAKSLTNRGVPLM